MNNLQLEERLKEAFDKVEMPDDLQERTLSAIEAARATPSERRLRLRKRTVRISCGIAACLVIALAGFFGYRYVSEPTAFVDIDINPSIELAVNRFDQVVAADALNDDAQSFIDTTNVIGKPYSEAIETLITDLPNAGYDLENPFLEFSISSDDAQQTAALETSTDAFINACGYSGNCNVVDPIVHEAAHACNMGVGKYLAAQELAELDPSVTIEDCSHMTMRQIRDNINACHQEAGSEYDAGYGNGVGNGDGDGNGASQGYGYGYGSHHGGYGQSNGAGNGQGNGSGAGQSGQGQGYGYGHQRHHSE